MTEDRVVAKIVELFYCQGINQYDIAKKFNFSTAKVCRLIKEAKNRDIIEFRIKKFDNRILELEREVEKAFNIKEVIIYYNSDFEDYDEDCLFQEVGALAAGYLGRIIEDGLNLALSWGKTLYNLVKNARVDKKRRVNIFATLGGANLIKPEYQNNSLIQTLGERIGGTAYPIYLPLVFETPSEEILKMESNIDQFLGSTSKIDYFFHGVGTVSEQARLYPYHGFDKEFIQTLKDKKIVGEVGFNFFDIDGRFIESGIEDRSIMLGIDKIEKMKTKVAIVCGAEKVNPLKGYLKTGLCDILITDSKTAFSVINK